MLESLATMGIKWLWDEYGKTISDRAFGDIRRKWAGFKWNEAEIKYRDHLRKQYSTTRLLGNPRPITLEDIYTDVYVLDKPSAIQRFDIETLEQKELNKEIILLPYERKPALSMVLEQKKIYILGKPGSGKTTFLKYLTLQACQGKIDKTPIFISIKEWSDSNLELMPFLVKIFDVCNFPKAQDFIEYLLNKGKAIVLFDGLDEVKQEGNQRSKVIQVVNDFAHKYSQVTICLTCRIAATDYTFDQFNYLEIADFDDDQIKQFVDKWYHDDNTKRQRLIDEYTRTENQGLHELARTPLLLALLCLAFDETLMFPRRRIDLYKDAIDALLKKWDASRDILRDEIYRTLSSERKEQMLARIAAKNFEKGRYFIRQDTLVNQINEYLKQLPYNDIEIDAFNGEEVLRAIEAQHGLLVERAHRIYSFSHLTFQEYFTARYYVENSNSGAIKRLIEEHAIDDNWHEIFLLIASLFNDADAFFEYFFQYLEDDLNKEDNLPVASFLKWIDKSCKSGKSEGARTRAIMLFIVIDIARVSRKLNALKDINNYFTDFETTVNIAFNLAIDLDPKSARLRSREREPIFKEIDLNNLNSNRDFRLARSLGINIKRDEIEYYVSLIETETGFLNTYLKICRLLVECLSLAVVSDRKYNEDRILKPPK